jgi:hypothetical protein
LFICFVQIGGFDTGGVPIRADVVIRHFCWNKQNRLRFWGCSCLHVWVLLASGAVAVHYSELCFGAVDIMLAGGLDFSERLSGTPSTTIASRPGWTSQTAKPRRQSLLRRHSLSAHADLE